MLFVGILLLVVRSVDSVVVVVDCDDDKQEIDGDDAQNGALIEVERIIIVYAFPEVGQLLDEGDGYQDDIGE